jgi:hypothetical protein
MIAHRENRRGRRTRGRVSSRRPCGCSTRWERGTPTRGTFCKPSTATRAHSRSIRAANRSTARSCAFALRKATTQKSSECTRPAVTCWPRTSTTCPRRKPKGSSNRSTPHHHVCGREGLAARRERSNSCSSRSRWLSWRALSLAVVRAPVLRQIPQIALATGTPVQA